jgi:DegV family protein with EDD domain
LAVRIVTDSTADLPQKFAHDLGISVVPLSVIFGDQVFREGVDISHDLFYDKLARGRDLPTTSAPSVGDFLEVYEPLLKETDEIVSIHVSSKLSATYNNAVQAAQMVADKGGKVDVVDSRSVSLGLTFVTLAAARVAREGGNVEAIKAAAESVAGRIRIYVMLDTLEYVRRGGRIGRGRAFLGAMLRVKPLLSLRDGEIHPEERVRTKAHAIERLFQIATSYPKVEEIAIGYSTNPQEAHDLQMRLHAVLPHVNILVTRVGPVIGTHAGPGVLAIGLLEGE